MNGFVVSGVELPCSVISSNTPPISTLPLGITTIDRTEWLTLASSRAAVGVPPRRERGEISGREADPRLALHVV